MTTWAAILMALLAASLEPVLAKMGYRVGVDPWQLLYIKSLVAAMVILPITRRWVALARPQIFPVVRVALLLFFTNACLLLAARRLPATLLITLLTTTPALVALVNQRRGRDRLTWRFWAGFALCCAGITLTLGFDTTQLVMDRTGICLALLAMATSTLYRTQLEDVTQVTSPLVVSTYIFGVHGLLAGLLLRPFLAEVAPPAYPIGIILGLAAALANVAFLYAIRRVGSTNMSLFNLLQRPLVVAFASLCLGETLSIVQWSGVILVLAGIRLAQVRR